MVSWGNARRVGTAASAESWYVHVAASRSGIPAVGYLRHFREKSGRGPIGSGTIGSSDFKVDGRRVTPGRNFILIYRDGDEEPRRLEISKTEAMELFGNGVDQPRVEKFWRETIEPLRKAAATKAGSP